jgi:hypothetical protein
MLYMTDTHNLDPAELKFPSTQKLPPEVVVEKIMKVQRHRGSFEQRYDAWPLEVLDNREPVFVKL